MTILTAILSGGALVAAVLAFVQFLVTRSDAKAEKNNAILKAIEALSEKLTGLEKRMDKDSADEARRNILLFDDELRRGDAHSEESFNQILEDCNYYTRYCRLHPEYENNKAQSAIGNIQHVYQQVKMEDRFI